MKRLIGIFIFLAIVLGLIFFIWDKQPKLQQAPENPAIVSATVLNPPKPLPNFSLQDSNGNPFSQKNLIGHWTLMFFGYADCPEICPTTLAIASGVWRAFAEQNPRPKAQFIFATLDPTNDTPIKLKSFLNRFHPDFIGITGNTTEMEQLTKAMSIYSWTAPKLNDKGQKIIDHSAILLLINPEGRLHAIFTPPHQIEELKKDLTLLLDR
jgi:protein SCO1/2